MKNIHEHGRSCCGHHHHPAGSAALKRAIAVTFVFMLLEFAGGIAANSLALVSDALHMLTDIGAMGLSLLVLWISNRPATSKMTFGYQRAEVLGGLANGVAIWLLAGGLIYQAILRFVSPPPVNGPVVLFVSLIGLGANLASMRFLHDARKHNLNIRGAYLHVLADCLGSVAAIITGIVLMTTGWHTIDPVVTVLISGLMILGSWGLVRESVGILMESSPSGIDTARVAADLRALEGVGEVHDLHVWTLSSGMVALSVHLVTPAPSDEILVRAHAMLAGVYGIMHTTIQIEHPDKFDTRRCHDCARRDKE